MNRKFRDLGCAALMAATVLGCGKAKPEDKSVKSLGPRVLAADAGNPDIPSRSEENAIQSPLSDGQTFAFEDMIWFPMADDQCSKLFLVWDRTALGPEITDAFYSADRADVYGNKTENMARRSAFFDKETSRWFVPLLDLVGGKVSGVSGIDLHRLRLELHFADGSVSYATVQFRMAAKCVSVKGVASLAASMPSDPSAFAFNTALGGWVIAGTEYQNAAVRAASLWAYGKGTALSLASKVARTTFEIYRSNPLVAFPGVRERIIASSATGALDLVLRVTRKDGGVEQGTLDGWREIKLAPGEKVAVEWLVAPTEGGQRCSMPPNVPLSFENVIFNNAFFARLNVNATARITGARLDGSWVAKLRYADSSVSEKVVRESRGTDTMVLRVLDEHSPESAVEIGERFSSQDAPALGCQGVLTPN